mmetsp:Transcript_20096/g.43726  ORF Transcript_20096/g.43726 Transcript_20096/m.43726 type:complete len:256 (+) Transcript_20096:477-1244(+)
MDGRRRMVETRNHQGTLREPTHRSDRVALRASMLRRTQGLHPPRRRRILLPSGRKRRPHAIELPQNHDAGAPHRPLLRRRPDRRQGQHRIRPALRHRWSLVHQTLVVWIGTQNRIAAGRRIHLLHHGHARRRLLRGRLVQTRGRPGHHGLRQSGTPGCRCRQGCRELRRRLAAKHEEQEKGIPHWFVFGCQNPTIRRRIQHLQLCWNRQRKQEIPDPQITIGVAVHYQQIIDADCRGRGIHRRGQRRGSEGNERL